MSSSDLVPVPGKIIEVLPSGKFRIQPTDEGQAEILAHLSGKMRQNKIRLVLGDSVVVEVSPYDIGKGRITRRKDK
jgi:translation initiation factor IF-1